MSPCFQNLSSVGRGADGMLAKPVVEEKHFGCYECS